MINFQLPPPITNLIILALNGDLKIHESLKNQTVFISVVTEIELLSIPFRNKREEYLMIDFYLQYSLQTKAFENNDQLTIVNAHVHQLLIDN